MYFDHTHFPFLSLTSPGSIPYHPSASQLHDNLKTLKKIVLLYIHECGATYLPTWGIVYPPGTASIKKKKKKRQTLHALTAINYQ